MSDLDREHSAEPKVEPRSKVGTPRISPDIEHKRRSKKRDPVAEAERAATEAAIRAKLARPRAPKGSPYEADCG